MLSRSRNIVATNLDHAESFAAAHQRVIEWVPPKAGSVAFPRFATLDATTVSERVAANGSALLMPGRVFGADPRHFRLGLGRRDFPHALSALTEELKTAS